MVFPRITTATSQYSDRTVYDVGYQPQKERRNILSRQWLMQDIDPEAATWPLVGYSFMTGWIDAIVWSAICSWAGSQTGSTASLALALARLFQDNGADMSFRLADRLTLTSILAFLFGGLLLRSAELIGPKTRAWFALGTIVQALCTVAAALLIWQSGQPSVTLHLEVVIWTNTMAFCCVAFCCASLGLQGVMAKRLDTHFATTVVVTSAWVELIGEPKLFHFRELVESRDHKVLGISSLVMGALLGRAMTQVQGAAISLGVGAGIRVLIAISFLLVPVAAKSSTSSTTSLDNQTEKEP